MSCHVITGNEIVVIRCDVKLLFHVPLSFHVPCSREKTPVIGPEQVASLLSNIMNAYKTYMANPHKKGES